MRTMTFTMPDPTPTGFIKADKELPYAEHVFGTRADAQPDVNLTIRTYTERLGPIAHMRQVHSNRFHHAHASGLYEECDALYTDQPDLWLGVKSADCVPVLISSPDVVAVAHCGWRGLENKLLPTLLETLIDEFALNPIDIFVHFGPCISQKNYEVEAHFEETFGPKFCRSSETKGKVKLDLLGIAKHQATEAGVPDLNIHAVKRCTYDEGHLFHSYRRHKQGRDDQPYAVQLSLIKRKIKGL